MRIKYSQSGGGGKFTKEYKDIYLGHCREIVFQNNIDSRNFLLSELHKDVIKAANETEAYQPFKDELLSSIEIIFGSINLSDPNSVGVVNVVSLQCATLFTYACLGFNQPTAQDFFNLNGLDRKFLEFTNNIPYRELPQNRKRDWRYYDNIDKSQGLLKVLYVTDSKKSRGIVTILDFLTMDEILLPYLEKWYLCGLVYEKTYADGRNMLPFGFVEHDIVHFQNFDSLCFQRHREDINEMKRFFDYINSIDNRATKYATKIIFFIQLHESWCDWNGNYSIQHFWSGLIRMERLLNDHDLGLLIPLKYRESEASRIAYVGSALENYRTQLNAFNRQPKGGSNKISYRLHRQRKTKKGKRHTKRKRQRQGQTKKNRKDNHLNFNFPSFR